MLKTTAIAYGPAVDDLAERLESVGVLDLTRSKYDLPDLAGDIIEQRIRALDEKVADAEFCVSFLGRFRTPDVALSSFISEKVHMSDKEFRSLVADQRFADLYRECELLAGQLASFERERAQLHRRIAELGPWHDLRLQISRWQGTVNVALFTGTVPSPDAETIRQRLRETAAEVSIEQLGSVGGLQAWVVMAHRSVVNEVRSALTITGFTEVSFPELSNYPVEEVRLAEARLERIARKEREAIDRATELAAEHYPSTLALSERLASDRTCLQARSRFGATERTVVIAGWVPEQRLGDLKDALRPMGSYTDLTFEEPSPDEEPPVLLDNPPWLRPFEALTELYGRPRYREVDPTPRLALFFWIFFGMTLGDVGYGAALVVATQAMKHVLDVGPGVKRFMDLLSYGGVSAMVIGVLTGSWFAVDPARLPSALRTMMLIDPVKDVLPALGVAIALGVVHIVYGFMISARSRLKDGDVEGAVTGPLAALWLLLVVVAFVLGVTGVLPSVSAGPVLAVGLLVALTMKGRAFRAPSSAGAAGWRRAVAWGWLGALFVWTIAAATGSAPAFSGWALLATTIVGVVAIAPLRATVLALLLGAYEIYGMTSLMSDFLSYTRLTALGLASTLVGQVVNLLAEMVWPVSIGPFPVGVLAGIAILVGMHAVNLGINLLGAFVHPTRLQFVEFFSKFYEGGGRAYAPFSAVTTSVVLHPAGRGQEGGALS